MTNTAPTFYRALTHPELCGPLLKGDSWRPWRAVMAAAFGVVPDDQQDRDLILRVTGRTRFPTVPALALWIVAGRRAGKTWMMAILMAIYGCLTTHKLALGERGVVSATATDRRQAKVLMDYVRAILQKVPAFRAMVVNETRDTIELSNNVNIEVTTASFRTIRGRTLVMAVCDELAFWRTGDSANPDVEILKAIRPAMATVPGALLVCISSPYSRSGELHKAYVQNFGKDDDRELVIQADTRTLNPTVPQSVIDRAYKADPVSASAEFGALFRADIESFISREAVEACVVPDRRELPPVDGISYFAFTDPSGGSSDSFTLAVGHKESEAIVVDCIREVRPPFSPETVVAEFVETMKAYGVHRVTGDRYGGEWPREHFRKLGCEYELADKTTSELFGALLPAINSAQVELLDNPRLLTQLLSLERRTSRGGKDSIGHPAGRGSEYHDDLINAVAGLVSLLTARQPVACTGMPISIPKVEPWPQWAEPACGRYF